jgi:hypothetical protein
LTWDSRTYPTDDKELTNIACMQTQLEMGFQRVGSDLEDIHLDFPNASKLFAGYRAQAVREGWLSDLAEPVQAAA